MPGLFGGGGGGGVAMQAAQIQSQAANRAAALQQQMYDQAVAREQPWVTAGTGAVGQLAGIYGVPGSTAVDPTQLIQNYPGYQFGLTQGTQALDRSAAARGMLLSGPQQKSLQTYGQQYGMQQGWNPYIQGLQNLSGAGQSGAALMGQQGLSTGQLMGQDYMTGAQAEAQGLYNAYYANQQAGQGWQNLLGMGIGIGLAPFTGGTSLIGAGLSGLSGLMSGFGGGGASSYGSYGMGTSWADGSSATLADTMFGSVPF